MYAVARAFVWLHCLLVGVFGWLRICVRGWLCVCGSVCARIVFFPTLQVGVVRFFSEHVLFLLLLLLPFFFLLFLSSAQLTSSSAHYNEYHHPHHPHDDHHHHRHHHPIHRLLQPRTTSFAATMNDDTHIGDDGSRQVPPVAECFLLKK